MVVTIGVNCCEIMSASRTVQIQIGPGVSGLMTRWTTLLTEGSTTQYTTGNGDWAKRDTAEEASAGGVDRWSSNCHGTH